MKFLIIGLGSMGKRRIRCLKALGYSEIYGFDIREDRRKEAEEKYNIHSYTEIAQAIRESNPTALIISVPPDKHYEYMKSAISNTINFFVEASVVDTEMDTIIKLVKNRHIIAVPSASLIFHPAIMIVNEIVKT